MKSSKAFTKNTYTAQRSTDVAYILCNIYCYKVVPICIRVHVFRFLALYVLYRLSYKTLVKTIKFFNINICWRYRTLYIIFSWVMQSLTYCLGVGLISRLKSVSAEAKGGAPRSLGLPTNISEKKILAIVMTSIICTWIKIYLFHNSFLLSLSIFIYLLY